MRGLLSVGSDAELAGYRARSHLHDGRVIAWTGSYDVPVAVDGEVERTVPAALARRFGTDGFWERWTRAECVAKLTGRGVLDLLDLMTGDAAGGDRPDAGVFLSTVRLPGGIVVSIGRSAEECSFACNLWVRSDSRGRHSGRSRTERERAWVRESSTSCVAPNEGCRKASVDWLVTPGIAFSATSAARSSRSW